MTILQRLVALVFIAVLPAIGIQAYNQLAVRDERQSEVRREALRLTQFADDEIARVIENGRGLLLGLSVQAAVRAHDSEACSAVMRELQPLFPQYLQIGAIDSQGHPFCANMPVPPPGTVWRGKNMNLFLGAPDFQVGFYTDSAFAKAPVLMLGLPYKTSDGQVGGVVFAGLDLAWLEQSFHDKFTDANTTLAVTDRDGIILLRLPDNQRYAGSRFGNQYLPYLTANGPGTDEIVAVDGITRILGYVPVDSGSPGLYVGIGITKSVALGAIDRASRLGLMLIGGGLLIALLAAWIGGRRFFSHPIARLLEAASAWSHGNFGVRAAAPAGGRSEIDQLGRAFDAMAASLESKQAENADLLATLEQRVAERTAALERETLERQRAEAALLQSQKLESIGQLTGGVAHDFNNLLTAILSNLDIARKRAAASGAAFLGQIDGALRAAERGATLTQRLLAFGRRQQLSPETLDLAAVLESLRELLSHAIGPQIRLVFAVASQLWNVSADRNQLELALLNLLLNARDAMPGGGRVTIAAENAATEIDGAARDGVLIRVTDTGLGMPRETLARAFDPFFTTKEPGRGSGLGLSMVYGFVMQSGGKAEIDSAPGRGTVVTLFLPRAAALAGGALVPEPAPEPVGGKGRLLVCDDDEDVLACMVEALEEYGYGCVAVRSGALALATLAGDTGFDAAILDFAMPEMSGSTVADRMRRDHPELPILLVTGYMETTDEPAAGLRFPTLRKPFLPHDLAREVARLLAGGSAAVAASIARVD